WYEELRQRDPCMHRDLDAGTDIVIGQRGENVALNFVDGVLIEFARLDLLEILGPELEEHLILGRLLDSSRRPIEEFKTLGSSRPLMIRGDTKSTRQFCQVCGEFLYHPMGRWYVLQSDLTGQAIYHSKPVGLVLNERLCEKMRRRHWKKIAIEEIPVR